MLINPKLEPAIHSISYEIGGRFTVRRKPYDENTLLRILRKEKTIHQKPGVWRGLFSENKIKGGLFDCPPLFLKEEKCYLTLRCRHRFVRNQLRYIAQNGASWTSH